jgi:hypothetical protein
MDVVGDERHQSSTFRSVCTLVVRNGKLRITFLPLAFLNLILAATPRRSTRNQFIIIY